MKSIFKNFLQFLEDFGRTKAATALARQGKYTEANAIINAKHLDK